MTVMVAPTIAGCKWIKVGTKVNPTVRNEPLSGLMYGQYVPIITLVVSTFTLIEAAGASDDYPTLKGTNKVNQTQTWKNLHVGIDAQNLGKFPQSTCQ